MHFKILSRSLVAVVGCFAFAVVTSDACAQQSSMFGTGGATGSGTSSANIASSAFPTTKFPTAGTPVGMGAGSGAQGGMGAGGPGGQQSGILGTATGPLIGTGAPAGATVPGQNGQMGNRAGQQNRPNANRGRGQNQNRATQPGGAAGAANQQKSTVRPQLKVEFDHPRPDAETMQLAITTRFSKLASQTRFKGIEVEADGADVILRGEVDSARTSRLATILARMEPGVKNVRNELTVTEPAPPATE